MGILNGLPVHVHGDAKVTETTLVHKARLRLESYSMEALFPGQWLLENWKQARSHQPDSESK